MSSSETLNTEEIKTDIVILGAGGAGIAAAITAKEKGVKDITILEALRKPGGNSALITAFFGAESPVQKRLGIDVSRDELFRQHMDYAHWKINARLVRALINISGDTIRWLEEMGLKFRVQPLYPNQAAAFHFCAQPKSGPTLMKALAKRCEDLGVRSLYNTAGKKLITDEKGKVIGVLAKAKGKELRVMAKCVIIATGGCLGNKKLMEKYYPDYDENVEDAGLLIKGEGLLMAMEVGAATQGMGTLELSGPDFRPDFNLFMIGIQPNTIWVNKRGERFADESVGCRHFGNAANTTHGQPGRISFALFDQKIKQRNTEEGLVGGALTWLWGDSKYAWGKAELPELERKIQTHVKSGRIKISDSWDEIARWMGAAPEVLKATVNKYNSFCDKGYDEIFAKERRYLVPLRTPPYYAIESHTHVYNTLGGIKVSHRMEALSHQDNPIPGLYVAGVDSGGWESDTYNAGLPGHSVGFSVNSGRIAGESAAKYVLGK